jgi:hypothetical protein
VRKRFDPNLHKENDKLARKAVKALMKDSGYKIKDNPKVRDVDMLVYKDKNHIFNIECEIKRVWKGQTFPYGNVQFPERKAKYAKLDKPTIFVMFNDDQSAFIALHGKDLILSPKAMVPNKYVLAGEIFYQVPLDKVSENDILKLVRELEA